MLALPDLCLKWADCLRWSFRGRLLTGSRIVKAVKMNRIHFHA